MILMYELNEYIKNLLNQIIKTQDFKAAIYHGSLYLITLGGLIYIIDISDKIPIDLVCSFTKEEIKDDCIIDNSEILLEVINSCQIYNYKNSFPCIFENNDLLSDPNFLQIIQAKSAEGAFRYYIPIVRGEIVKQTFLILYYKMFNLTKADKVALHVYNTDRQNLLLADFSIYKKKAGANYHLYFIFMDLIGGLEK